jgi:hypothetical protein
MDEINREYINFINFSLKKMDDGYYEESLINLKKIISANHFKNLKTNDQLFIRKRISWVQLSLGYYEEGWNNFVYNWLKNSHKFKEIKKENNNIKYLINFKQIQNNEKLLIWNDGGYGDFIYQLRLLKYIEGQISFKIYGNKMSHLIRNQNLIISKAKGFDWHLPINEIPRIINYNPYKHTNYTYDYLIKPNENFKHYSQYVALSYKTETSKAKSINHQLLDKLFIKKKDINFLILQNNLNENEKSFFSAFKNVATIENLDNSLIFKDTFNIINSAKFVISIDTATTHISGYLGKKNYLLLNHPSSFYWSYNKLKSTDYQNHVIIRQKYQGDWTFAINQLINLI